jgi:RNA-binding protein YlmH
MDREQILARFEHDSERLAAGIMLDRISQVEKTGRFQHGDFLDPFLARAVERALNLFKQVRYISWGGYPGAERVRHLVFPATRQAGTEDVPLSYVAVEAGASAGELTHRDFLGAILGLGLRRDKVGDILLAVESGAQVVVAPEILPVLLSQLDTVGRHSVRVREIGAGEIVPALPRVREIRTTVASLRLDAVASAGFGTSRSKIAPAIRAGLLKLNWQSVKNAAAVVKEGDVISFGGRGRLELSQVAGESKKGRVQILLKKLT